jgi:8-oxo-dGTP pyrophosphatase MutT (NUDIX family)
VNKDLADRIANRLQQPLPGKDLQFLMAPKQRESLKNFNYNKSNTTDSAVLISLFPFKEELYTVFILRADYKGVHSGQISFPGGRKDKQDENLIQTALREAQEETGIKPDNVNILGQLTELYVYPSNFIIYPFIGYLNEKPDFIPDPKEVKDIIVFPLEKLCDDRIRSSKLIKAASGLEIEAPYYNLNGHVLWGATAMIVSEFVQVLREI